MATDTEVWNARSWPEEWGKPPDNALICSVRGKLVLGKRTNLEDPTIFHVEDPTILHGASRPEHHGFSCGDLFYFCFEYSLTSVSLASNFLTRI